jgi:hypothetical protein
MKVRGLSAATVSATVQWTSARKLREGEAAKMGNLSDTNSPSTHATKSTMGMVQLIAPFFSS